MTRYLNAAISAVFSPLMATSAYAESERISVNTYRLNRSPVTMKPSMPVRFSNRSV